MDKTKAMAKIAHRKMFEALQDKQDAAKIKLAELKNGESHIQKIFNPATIALIGATEKRGAVGRTILENLLRSKERKIFPVNLLMKTALDMKSHFTSASVPNHVNLAVVAPLARSVSGNA
ncbi:MAG: hypothetical protein JW884_12255 [Deltaproteobacteria bacterium]|nr:hypothetical protein [Deltaproteobacteria bacterium]